MQESLDGGYAVRHGLIEGPALNRLLHGITDIGTPGNAEAMYRLLSVVYSPA
jgi:hypothetical protein